MVTDFSPVVQQDFQQRHSHRASHLQLHCVCKMCVYVVTQSTCQPPAFTRSRPLGVSELSSSQLCCIVLQNHRQNTPVLLFKDVREEVHPINFAQLEDIKLAAYHRTWNAPRTLLLHHGHATWRQFEGKNT